jgi:hypothetical protein
MLKIHICVCSGTGKGCHRQGEGRGWYISYIGMVILSKFKLLAIKSNEILKLCHNWNEFPGSGKNNLRKLISNKCFVLGINFHGAQIYWSNNIWDLFRCYSLFVAGEFCHFFLFLTASLRFTSSEVDLMCDRPTTKVSLTFKFIRPRFCAANLRPLADDCQLFHHSSFFLSFNLCRLYYLFISV